MANKNKIIAARFPQKDAKRGEDISGFVRRAVKRDLARLSFYTKDEKKALGVDRGERG